MTRRPDERYARLADLLPKHNYKVAPAAKEAGFSASYAEHQADILWRNLAKYQARAILANPDAGTIEKRRNIAERLGMSSEDVLSELLGVIKQNRDLTNKLKALTPLLLEQGIDITGDTTQQVITPTLNVTIKGETRAIDKDTVSGTVIGTSSTLKKKDQSP